jgi:hypothetical protein
MFRMSVLIVIPNRISTMKKSFGKWISPPAELPSRLWIIAIGLLVEGEDDKPLQESECISF